MGFNHVVVALWKFLVLAEEGISLSLSVMISGAQKWGAGIESSNSRGRWERWTIEDRYDASVVKFDGE